MPPFYLYQRQYYSTFKTKTGDHVLNERRLKKKITISGFPTQKSVLSLIPVEFSLELFVSPYMI